MIPTTHKLPGGFSIRPASMDDLGATVNLFNTCGFVETGIKLFDPDEYKLEWQTPGFNLAEDTRLVFAPGGQLAGAAEVWTVRNPPVHPWVYVRVHPNYTGLGIGTYLTAWGETRARDAIARVPDNARVVMRCGVNGNYQPSQQFLADYGMQLVRYFWDMEIEMDAAPPAPQWPDGITMRVYTHPQDIKLTYLAVDEAFKDHWGHVDGPVDEGLARWRAWLDGDKDFDPSLWFLAMDGDQIAGMSLCRPKISYDSDRGWVDILGVRRPWRKRGLGLALLRHSFGEFYRRGKLKAGLSVDAASLTGATRLYEKAGMHVARQYADYEKELRPGKELATE